MSAAHYRDEIGVVDSMLDLVDPRRSKGASPQAVLSIQAAQVISECVLCFCSSFFIYQQAVLSVPASQLISCSSALFCHDVFGILHDMYYVSQSTVGKWG